MCVAAEFVIVKPKPGARPKVHDPLRCVHKCHCSTLIRLVGAAVLLAGSMWVFSSNCGHFRTCLTPTHV